MFKLFRKKMEHSKNCSLRYESSFILEGTSAVEIYVLRLDEIKQAALIITDKEGPDTTLVYTFKKDKPEEELLKADYFTWNKNTYFVYENIDITREAFYIKQRAYQCNAEFVVDNNTYYGYFVSSLSKYVDTTLQKDLIIVDNEKPVLVMPYYDWLSIGKRLVIGGKTWKIIDFDLITNNSIAYISLDRDFNTTFEDVVEAQSDSDNAANELVAGKLYNWDINFGYFKSSEDIEIVSKTANKVNFIIPYGINEITITTKDSNKIDIVNTYQVVLK